VLQEISGNGYFLSDATLGDATLGDAMVAPVLSALNDG
jgi:hypothetical protein